MLKPVSHKLPSHCVPIMYPSRDSTPSVDECNNGRCHQHFICGVSFHHQYSQAKYPKLWLKEPMVTGLIPKDATYSSFGNWCSSRILSWSNKTEIRSALESLLCFQFVRHNYLFLPFDFREGESQLSSFLCSARILWPSNIYSLHWNMKRPPLLRSEVAITS